MTKKSVGAIIREKPLIETCVGITLSTTTERSIKRTRLDFDVSASENTEMTGAAPVTPPTVPVERGHLARPRRRPDEPFLVEQIPVTPFSRSLIRQYNGRKAREIVYRVDLMDQNLSGLDLVRDERRLHDLWSRLMKHMHRDENVGDEDLVRFHFNHPSLTSGHISKSIYSALRT